MEDIDAQLERLKSHFGVDKDAELARKLMVDKRTVSAWRARGGLPDRYKSILEGGDPQTVMTPPARWDEHERAAFDLAMLRLARAVLPETTAGEFRPVMQAYGGAWAFFWALMIEARHDIVAQMNSGPKEVRSAFAILVHSDLEQGSDSVQRVRSMLVQLGKVADS
jgi:hypothetical protein